LWRFCRRLHRPAIILRRNFEIRAARQLKTDTTGRVQEALEDAFVNVDGALVHYVHAGSGNPIVLIHGLTGSTGNWRRNIDALARDASVYAIDLVNMGKSARVAGLDASLAATADRVAAWMEAMGLAQADIAGHSHGGAVAMMLAARHPERVRSLVLFAPANPFSDSGDALIRLYSSAPGRRLARLAPYVPRWAQLILLGRMYGDPARIVEGSLEGYVEGGRIPGTIDHVLAIVRGWSADMAALKEALPRIASFPTLLVWGDRDRAVSLASGLRLERELPHSRLIVIPGAGHVVFEELPEVANPLMHDWLSRDPEASYAAQPRLDQPLPEPAVTRSTLASTLQHLSTSVRRNLSGT
jgi:pimeloyl-ACP methyl ester carboxylesterase